MVANCYGDVDVRSQAPVQLATAALAIGSTVAPAHAVLYCATAHCYRCYPSAAAAELHSVFHCISSATVRAVGRAFNASQSVKAKATLRFAVALFHWREA